MKIAAYNMRKGGTQRVHWRRLIENHSIDLLLAQESFHQTEHLPADEFPELSGQSHWNSAGNNRWGSSVFSASGVVSPISVYGYKGWVTGVQVSEADWQTRGERLFVFSLHAPNGPGSYRGQVAKILDRIGRVTKGAAFILGGDFNISVSQSNVSDRPIHHRDLAIQSRMVNEFQLMNCYTSANPDEPLPQTLRWTGDQSVAYHCDGIFAPQTWKPRLKSSEVLSNHEWDALSDHNPVVATFE